MARPYGQLKRAAAPAPSALPQDPIAPAKTSNCPAAVSSRITQFPESATYTLFLLSTAIAKSGPGVVPDSWARVVTTPAGVTLRIVPLLTTLPTIDKLVALLSATYKLPAASVAMPTGLVKRAAAPSPSAVPYNRGTPASVLTMPVGSILRIARFPLSA